LKLWRRRQRYCCPAIRRWRTYSSSSTLPFSLEKQKKKKDFTNTHPPFSSGRFEFPG
jgi:hypothetical protein